MDMTSALSSCVGLPESRLDQIEPRHHYHDAVRLEFCSFLPLTRGECHTEILILDFYDTMRLNLMIRYFVWYELTLYDTLRWLRVCYTLLNCRVWPYERRLCWMWYWRLWLVHMISINYLRYQLQSDIKNTNQPLSYQKQSLNRCHGKKKRKRRTTYSSPP